MEIAVELGPEVSKLGRARIFRAKAKHIADYSAEEISKAMDKMIDRNAVVVTDEWRSYRKALGTRIHLPIPSGKGDAMPEIHRLIFNLKNWLRGTHHKVSDFHLEQYLNEFFCRFNFRNCLESLPFKILNQMIRHHWKPYQQVIAA